MTRGERLERWSRKEVRRLTRGWRFWRGFRRAGLVLYLIAVTGILGFSVKRFLDFTTPAEAAALVEKVNVWKSYCREYTWMPGCSKPKSKRDEDRVTHGAYLTPTAWSPADEGEGPRPGEGPGSVLVSGS